MQSNLVQHDFRSRPAVQVVPPAAQQVFEVVNVAAIRKPCTVLLLMIRKLKNLPPDKAVRVPLKILRKEGRQMQKAAHTYADRYGYEIGTRFQDDYLYIWKLDVEERAVKQAIAEAKRRKRT
jgi:hypothetical protein